MTHTYSRPYPVFGGPSKFDLMLALFDREHDVRVVRFNFGAVPLPDTMPGESTWSLAFRQGVGRWLPETFESEASVIGVTTVVTKGESFHIKAHVEVPKEYFVGQKGGRATVTMLAEIYFRTDSRKGNVRFMLIHERQT